MATCNIPDRAKSMFITDPDYVFIYIDGSQAEARVVGWRYVIDTWMQQFEKARIDGKYDAHRALAADMFDTPYNQVPTFDRYALDEAAALRDGIKYDAQLAGQATIRYIAKRCRHGLNYRMMPDRLALTTGLPLATATEASSNTTDSLLRLRRAGNMTSTSSRASVQSSMHTVVATISSHRSQMRQLKVS